MNDKAERWQVASQQDRWRERHLYGLVEVWPSVLFGQTLLTSKWVDMAQFLDILASQINCWEKTHVEDEVVYRLSSASLRDEGEACVFAPRALYTTPVLGHWLTVTYWGELAVSERAWEALLLLCIVDHGWQAEEPRSCYLSAARAIGKATLREAVRNRQITVPRLPRGEWGQADVKALARFGQWHRAKLVFLGGSEDGWERHEGIN